MSITSEIQRLQNAKQALKTKINAKNDSEHQIDDETLDAFGPFVDDIERLKIFDTVEEMNNDNDKHLGDKALVYGPVASPIEEDTIFRKFVKPSGNIILEQNIMKYIDELKDIDLDEEEGQEFDKVFYDGIYWEEIEEYDEEQEEEPEVRSFDLEYLALNIKQDYDEDTQTYGNWKYLLELNGYFTTPVPPEYQGVGRPYFYMEFVSYDGVTFTPSFNIAYDIDYDTGSWIFVPQDYIESEVDINFSDGNMIGMRAEWNDILSEFLFTDEVKFNGVYEVEEGENETLVYELIGPFLQNKSIEVNENGTISISADSGYDALNTVALNVNVSGGGGSTEENDVNFYDYDGTLIDSYSAEDFLQLSAMPTNPSHTGLVAQGWNWTLADAKAYVQDYGILDVGQNYITDDGKTRLYITLEEDRKEPYLGFATIGTATIDWGDGNTETVTGSSPTTIIYTQHSYSNAGNYIITLQTSSTIYLKGFPIPGGILTKNSNKTVENLIYNGCLTKVELGENVALSSYGFSGCRNLSKISISNAANFSSQMGIFKGCINLKAIVVPPGNNIYSDCFGNCSNLEKVSLPKNSRIENGAFQSTNITHFATPANATALPDFSGCKSLKHIIFPASVTEMSGITNNDAIEELEIPNQITRIGSIMSCSRLRKITLPNQLIQCSGIKSNPLLVSLKIPKTLTTISYYGCFSGNSGIKFIDFSEHETVPALTASGVFNDNASDYKIIVPDNLYNDWIAATNWTSYADYIVKESDYNA